jgi:hypothetical protein
MSHAPIPWLGLAALAAMFLLPFLPSGLFEGPRTVKHRPLRHICGDCNAPWTGDHVCAPELVEAGPPAQSLRGELRRIDPVDELEPASDPGTAELERRPRVRISR